MIFASTEPINDDPAAFVGATMMGKRSRFETKQEALNFSGIRGAGCIRDARSEYNRPRAHESNPILIAWRNGRDPYQLLFDLKSRWSMQFSHAQIEHAQNVIETWIEVFK